MIIRRNPRLPMQCCDNFPMNTVTALSTDLTGSITGLPDTKMTAKVQSLRLWRSVCWFVTVYVRRSFGVERYLASLERSRAGKGNP